MAVRSIADSKSGLEDLKEKFLNGSGHYFFEIGPSISYDPLLLSIDDCERA